MFGEIIGENADLYVNENKFVSAECTDSIETVFQHSITEQEKEKIGLLDMETYMNVVDGQSARLDLAFLYYLRGDDTRVRHYLEGLPPLVVNDFWRTITHP